MPVCGGRYDCSLGCCTSSQSSILEDPKAVMDGKRRLPKKWGLPIMISECSIDAGHRLRWRGRIWIPALEPLRTRWIESIHDSPLSGHSGREST